MSTPTPFPNPPRPNSPEIPVQDPPMPQPSDPVEDPPRPKSDQDDVPDPDDLPKDEPPR